MYSKSDIEDLVFFDIETIREHNTLADLAKANPRGCTCWFRASRKFHGEYNIDQLPPDFSVENMKDFPSLFVSLDKCYQEKTQLMPEFAKIYAVSIGVVTYKDGLEQKHVSSIRSDNEKEILEKVSAVFDRAYKKSSNRKLCGHNIIDFDIPFIIKRMIKNNVSMPKILKSAGSSLTKPWDKQIVDTIKDWKFGAFTGFVSLDLLCNFLGLDNPKIDPNGYIDPKNLTDAMFNPSKYGMVNRLDVIEKGGDYCNRDVVATIDVVLEYSKKW